MKIRSVFIFCTRLACGNVKCDELLHGLESKSPQLVFYENKHLRCISDLVSCFYVLDWNMSSIRVFYIICWRNTLNSYRVIKPHVKYGIQPIGAFLTIRRWKYVGISKSVVITVCNIMSFLATYVTVTYLHIMFKNVYWKQK